MPIFRGMRTFSPASDGLARKSRRISPAAYDAFCAELARTAAPRKHWCNWAEPRLWVMPLPRAAESCLDDDGQNYAPWRDCLQTKAASPAALDRYYDVVASFYAALSIGLLRPESAVIAASGLTRREMTRGSVGLDNTTAHLESDHYHMNAEYGAIMLAATLRRVLAHHGADIGTQGDRARTVA